MLISEEVLVSRVDLQNLIHEINDLKKIVIRGEVRAKLDVLCDSEVVNSKIVKKIMGWSETTFQRRLNDTKNPILMTKENGTRWTMTKQEFLEYYESLFTPKYKF
jgi:hypothetical protein